MATFRTLREVKRLLNKVNELLVPFGLRLELQTTSRWKYCLVLEDGRETRQLGICVDDRHLWKTRDQLIALQVVLEELFKELGAN